jgi:hypothetical protein
MEKFIQDLEGLLNNPDVPDETKAAIKGMLKGHKERQENLAKEMDRILRKQYPTKK